MNDKSILKVNKVKKFLYQKGIFYTELTNGQLQIDGINLWATSEKYYDPKTGIKGKGINSFIEYLKNKQVLNINMSRR